MAEPARKLWTLDEFPAFDDGTDTRYELIGGELVAMAPATRAHVVLAGRLASRIGGALRPPCEVATEAGMVPPRKPNNWYKADVVVTCTPGQPGDPYIAEPVVVVEVLSPSTAVVDRGRKLPDDREIPSVQDILLVSSTEPRVEHWRRTADGWRAQELQGEGAVRLEALGITVDLRALYEGVLPSEGAEEKAPNFRTGKSRALDIGCVGFYMLTQRFRGFLAEQQQRRPGWLPGRDISDHDRLAWSLPWIKSLSLFSRSLIKFVAKRRGTRTCFTPWAYGSEPWITMS